MQSPANTNYSNTYFAANPNLPIVCQVTPMVTTLEVQYNQSNLTNVNSVLEQVLLPNDSLTFASIQASVIWGAYFLAQGQYSNSFADDLLEVVQLLSTGPVSNVNYTLLLVSKCATLVRYVRLMVKQGEYIRGVFDYMGSVTFSSYPPIRGLTSFIRSCALPSSIGFYSWTCLSLKI